jgi:tetratricopeptide (TPR) repeat protein
MIFVLQSVSMEERQKQALEASLSGDMMMAISILREVVPMTEQCHGAESLETAQSVFTLALCIFQADRSEESLAETEMFARKAFEIRRKIRGDVDASVAITSELLISVYQLMEKYQEAESMCRVSLDIAERLVGTQHVNTGKAQYRLARVLILLGTKLEEATELLEKCTETRRRLFGPNSEETVQSMTALAEVWEKRGNPEKAKEVLIEAENLDRLIDRSALAPNQQCMR